MNFEPVLLPQNLALSEPGEKMLYAYFLEDGMASIAVTMKMGPRVEVIVVIRMGAEAQKRCAKKSIRFL